MDLAEVHRRMEYAISENYAAKSAIDCTMYDLSSKALGIPLYKLLGGKCRDSVSVNRHIGIVSDFEAQKIAGEYLEQGFLKKNESRSRSVGGCTPCRNNKEADGK